MPTSHVTRSDTLNDVNLLTLGESYHLHSNENRLYLKMHGHEIYKYAVKIVPEVVMRSLEKAGLTLFDVNKL